MLRKLALVPLLALLLLSAACGGPASTAAPSAPANPVATPAIAPGGESPPATPAAPPADAFFIPTTMLELFDSFAVLEMTYGDAPDYRHDVGFRVEGADAYGERIVIYSESASHEVTIWIQDGLISRTEPDYPEVIGTNGNKLGDLGFIFFFTLSELYSTSQVDGSGVQAIFLDNETRDLGAARVQAMRYRIIFTNPASGQETILMEFWIAEIEGQEVLIEFISPDGFGMKIIRIELR